MIARLWEGEVPAQKGPRYLEYMREIALRDYAATPGNRGAWCLHRSGEEAVKIVMFTLWDDLDSIRAFAGDDPTVARYYDFDPDYLLEMTPRAVHFDVMAP
ncbi:MAG TPA: antibiotic biosynthesis monooxygenase [Brevundimonas sp.]|nr:antibiotic biosynthesis monooxygenase [Brevundimonas sp.]